MRVGIGPRHLDGSHEDRAVSPEKALVAGRKIPRLGAGEKQKGAGNPKPKIENCPRPWCLVTEVSDLICRVMEGRGFSPAAKLRRDFGALAPEATRLQGLKARSTPRAEAAGLKPRPPEAHRQYRLLVQLSSSPRSRDPIAKYSGDEDYLWRYW